MRKSAKRKCNGSSPRPIKKLGEGRKPKGKGKDKVKLDK